MAKPKSLKQSIPGIRDLLKFMRPYTRQHRPLIAGSFLALFAGVLMRALEPWPLKMVIDHVILPVVPQTATGGWIASLQP